MKFKAIIFDLGGVILNIDYHKTIEAFKSLGIEEFERLYAQAQQSQLFDQLEVGAISDIEFYKGIQHLTDVELSEHDIKMAWNTMLLDLPKERITFLQNIAQEIPIFLLSNTNEIHLKACQAIIKNTFGKANLLEDIFVETFYSHLIKARKPHAEAFQMIIDKHQLSAPDTLFIDDSIQHIEGAQKVGLQTHHLVGEDITTLFT